jgi:exodeoxyribonuclease V gamma subunit
VYLYRSNRVETLVEALCDVLREPSGGPLDPEVVLVHSNGMETWLSHEIGERLGICANVRFPFPRKFVPELFRAVLGPRAAGMEQWHREQLTWTILSVLPDLLPRPELAEIAGYLRDDESGLKHVQLAERIAHVFDDYVVYRGDLIRAWERGQDGGWQAVLWRALHRVIDAPHAAGLAGSLEAALRSGRTSALPNRISLFGIATLAPVHLRIFDALSAVVDVHMFMLRPTPEFFGDIRSKPEQARAREIEYLEEGNPLLASLGRLGREFQQILVDQDIDRGPSIDLDVDPGTETLLTAIQSDIFGVRHRRAAEGYERPLALEGDDGSLEIHACHGPMRQVEVLRDRLLALFADDPGLEPRDILVMTPDMDVYSPLIEAAFARGPGDPCHIPFTIADRALRYDSPVAEAFFRVLDLANARLTAPEVLDLLALEPVRQRFGLAAEDLDTVSHWVADSGIRWGIDAKHREALGQPEYGQNTWQFGLDRLLLGYAMPGDGRRLFGDALPYDEVEGLDGPLLGALCDFTGALFDAVKSLQEPRSVAAWHRTLIVVLDRLLATTYVNGWQHQQIRELLIDLADRASVLGDSVDLAVMKHLLRQHFDTSRSPYGFLTGGVTFCAMLPMRSIPFRVVCLLGMDETAFPRATRRLGFDRIALEPRPGDRSTRHDDRYLFLEALLSARERMIITYTGRRIHDNREVPPSVVVSELIDAVGEAFETEPGYELVKLHPLQPFSARNFVGPTPSSFSAVFLEAARARRLSNREPEPFFNDRLALESADRQVDADDLLAFFNYPIRRILNRGLGIRLTDRAEPLDEREPVQLSALEQWGVGNATLTRVLAGDSLEDALPTVRGLGILPLGAPGRLSFARDAPTAQAIGAAFDQLTEGREERRIEVDFIARSGRVTGRLRSIYGDRSVVARYGKIRGKHLLELWIRHLLLVVDPESGVETSVLVGRSEGEGDPESVFVRAVDNPRVYLEELLSLYWTGQTEPLLLFPEASRRYFSELGDTPDNEQAQEQARRSILKDWRQRLATTYQQHEGDDPHIVRVLGDAPPFEPEFRLGPIPSRSELSFHQLAIAVFAPLQRHIERVS